MRFTGGPPVPVFGARRIIEGPRPQAGGAPDPEAPAAVVKLLVRAGHRAA